MMKMRAALLVVALLVVSWAVVAQGVRRDGKWEVKAQGEMNGAPGLPPMPPETITQCVTPKDVDDPLKVIPGADANQLFEGCKFQDHKVDGNKATWSMKCDGPPVVTGTVELIYAANAYTGTLKVSFDVGGMTVKFSAKRLAARGTSPFLT